MIYYSCITYTKLHIHGKQNVWPGQMTSNSNQKKSAICPCPRFPAFHSLLVDLCAQRAAQRLVQYVFLHAIQPTQTIHFLRSLATWLGFSCCFRLFQCHVFGDASSFANCCKPVLLWKTITVWSTHKQIHCQSNGVWDRNGVPSEWPSSFSGFLQYYFSRRLCREREDGYEIPCRCWWLASAGVPGGWKGGWRKSPICEVLQVEDWWKTSRCWVISTPDLSSWYLRVEKYKLNQLIIE